jgi:hypothetical protein
LRTFEVLNEWQELDEEEESDAGQELLSSYGPLSVILYSRVKKHELFPVPAPSLFLEKLVAFYMKNAANMEKDPTAMKTIKLLVSFFPTYKEFKELLKSNRFRGRDFIFFKLALDILTVYYKTIELPLFKKLQCEIIPLALSFYSSLTNSCLHDIVTELMSCIDNRSKFIVK